MRAVLYLQQKHKIGKKHARKYIKDCKRRSRLIQKIWREIQNRSNHGDDRWF